MRTQTAQLKSGKDINPPEGRGGHHHHRGNRQHSDASRHDVIE